jgi:outer membrane immunogenic protein
LVGGTLGYNYQFNSIVIGAEMDFDWANIKGSGGQSLSVAPIPVALTTTSDSQLKWLGTLRARLGYTITPTTLLFVTGGGAYGQVNSTTTIALTAPKPFGATASADVSDNKWGWTVGGGIEQKLWSGFSIKAEADYIDLGTQDAALGATVLRQPIGFTTSRKLQYERAIIGLNYQF